MVALEGVWFGLWIIEMGDNLNLPGQLKRASVAAGPASIQHWNKAAMFMIDILPILP
jgi:hypothetical protein